MPKIVSTPTILGGKKRISGTRISVDLVYMYLKDKKLTQFRRDYPHITDKQIDTVARHLIRTMQLQRKKLGRPTA